MAPFRYRDDDDSSGSWLFIAAGAVVGLAAGLLVAQRFGGLSGVTSRIRESIPEDMGERLGRRFRRARAGAAATAPTDADEYEEYDDDYDDSSDEELEERVLEAYRNDPILAERPIDIGSIGASTIELTGWVFEANEAEHAVTVAGGVPGVESVVNRLEVRAETETLDENRRRFDEGDDALREARWEGQGVGTGRRRQGNSGESDRHSDPSVNLKDRWQSKDQAMRAAAEDVDAGTGRSVRASTARGVPKADHVSDPTASSPDSMRAD